MSELTYTQAAPNNRFERSRGLVSSLDAGRPNLPRGKSRGIVLVHESRHFQ
jgi:hypothetical protein